MTPHWIIALVVLAAGLLMGEIAGRVARSSMSRENRSPEVREMARPVGGALFWASTAVGILVAVASWSPTTLEHIPARTMRVLPNVLVAGLFLIAGYALAIGISAAVGQSALRASGIRQRGLERLLRISVMGSAVVLALSQVGLDTTVLVILLVTLLGAPCLSMALLTGLGGRQVATNLAAGRALRHQLQVDRYLVSGSVRGVICAVHPVTVEVLTDDGGILHVPLSALMDAPFAIYATRPSRLVDQGA